MTVRTREPVWEMEIFVVFDHHKRYYGIRHLSVELREEGHRIGRHVLRTGLRTGLRRHRQRALQPKTFTPRTTDSTHGRRYAPNLLLDQPRPTQTNRVLVGDITYLLLVNGTRAHLCAFQELFTKHVVGWQVQINVTKVLVTSNL